MKILVTFAMAPEFAPWRKLREFRAASLPGEVRQYVAGVQGAEVRVLLTGIGLENAERHLNRVMGGEQLDVVISSGLAGALRTEHSTAQILAAREVCSESGDEAVPTDAVLLGEAEQAGGKVVERFCSARRIVVSAAEKQRLGRVADAVDMESLGVMKAATSRGVRAIAVRAISDAAGDDLPLDFNRVVDERGGMSVGRAVSEVVKNPAAIPALVRFGSGSRRAAVELARFLDGYVQAIAATIALEQQPVMTR